MRPHQEKGSSSLNLGPREPLETACDASVARRGRNMWSSIKSFFGSHEDVSSHGAKTFHDITAVSNAGDSVSMAQFKGKVLIVVNVATQ